jgi:PAS domain S-box-containing protein
VAKLERIALRKAGPKDADRELDRAWSEWEATFDAIGDSVILLDSEFNIVQANAATSILLGKPLDEIVGQRCCKLVHGSYEPLENCPLVKAKTTRTREKAESYIAEKGIWALVSVDPILDEQGNLTGAVHIIRDITERKKAEEALQKSVRLLRDTGEMAKVGGWELDLSTNEVSWTEEVGRIHGVEPGYKPKLEEALNFYAPESRPAVEAVVKKAAETGEPYDLESLFIPLGSKDKIWVRSLGKAVYSGGKIVKLAGTFQNIDKYKRAEEEIETLAKFPAENPAPVLRISKDCRILYANNASSVVLETWGRQEGERLPEACCKLAQQALRSGKVSTFEFACHDGRTFEVKLAPVAESGYVNAYGFDITDRKEAEQQVRQSEQKYKELFESAREAIIIMDLNGKITDANRTVEEYGHTRDYLLGKSIFDFIPVNHRARAARDFDELCHGTPVKGEMEVIAPKGNLTVEYRDNPIVRGGQIVAVQAILMDITERKQAEQQLAQSESRLKMTVDAVDLGTWDWDLVTGEIIWGGHHAELFGFDPGEFDGRYESFESRIHPDDLTGINHAVQESIQKGADYAHEYRVVRPDGTIRWVAGKGRPILDDNGKAVRMMGIAYDITERKHAEQALRDYQAELKSLASELALAEERERHRIAAGIHDDIGQKLALAKMELQLLARSPGKSKIPASLDSVCARIDEAIKDAHSLTFELSNPALYDLSFAAAIELWLLERIQKKHGIKCTVIAGEQAVPLDENSKVVLFRAVRELAVNVVKHAKATALTVTIEKLENSVQITCKDDGLGFTPPKGGAAVQDAKGGFGLFNIKERLEYLGGGMKLQSAPGHGTLITLSLPAAAGLPLERQHDADADEVA